MLLSVHRVCGWVLAMILCLSVSIAEAEVVSEVVTQLLATDVLAFQSRPGSALDDPAPPQQPYDPPPFATTIGTPNQRSTAFELPLGRGKQSFCFYSLRLAHISHSC